MTNGELLRIAAAIIWAEAAARIFAAHQATCPPELGTARLVAAFSLDALELLRDELEPYDRRQLDAYLDQVRGAIAAKVPADPPAEGATA